MARQRLPETPSLTTILPKGTEGGKEFARIVDLLLYHLARREGRIINLFSDAAGDFFGLDSFGETGDKFYKDIATGYQYKFYPSPLSSSHRGNIKTSLKTAIAHQKELKLKKWILITPEDLTESSTREDKGDVHWFNGLKEEMKADFDLEHWGHRKLQWLFLETPLLCLYYYPELQRQGHERKKTIKETRVFYNENLKSRYKSIEFVGMSIYKPEAAHGIPMEDIYIPLGLVSDKTGSDDLALPRTNPLKCLDSRRRTVILGDPGSGKSTMLRFLALAGISEPLQTKYSCKPDERLPVLVLLRRYADELTSRPNLSLLDYIIELIKADFSLSSADQEFFEYYFESGQALLFFDGLDELSNPELKQSARNRIKSFSISYPGNTIIVTSRIVGYEHPFRFEEHEFIHQRVAKLELPEIEQFVRDWYAVRIEHPVEQEESASDLIRIVAKDAGSSIRELAGNPLLLTIIALVHRIDAVLPDERVVLYQKCTETLLNTWHKWKFRNHEAAARGKIERRNSRRMEAIAHWMQIRAEKSLDGQRAVVDHDALLEFLASYVHNQEKIQDIEGARDQASEFLEFVKRRAGLLIEVGDRQYSFVHLTFQEYLTASYLMTQCEKEGVNWVWAEILAGRRCDPAWREVIRLFAASLKSDDSQEYLINQLLEISQNTSDVHESTLAGGLLLDGIEAAEERQAEIAIMLLRSALAVKHIEEIRSLAFIWKSCSSRNLQCNAALRSSFQGLWSESDDEGKLTLLLFWLVSDGSAEELEPAMQEFLLSPNSKYPLLRLLTDHPTPVGAVAAMPRGLPNFVNTMQWAVCHSPSTNLLAAATIAIFQTLDPSLASDALFRFTSAAMQYSVGGGPLRDWWVHLSQLGMFASQPKLQGALVQARQVDLRRQRERHFQREGGPQVTHSVFAPLEPSLRERGDDLENLLDFNLDRIHVVSRQERVLERAFGPHLEALRRAGSLVDNFNPSEKFDVHWKKILAEPIFDPAIQSFVTFICNSFSLNPRLYWQEALRTIFLPSIPYRMLGFDQNHILEIIKRFKSCSLVRGDIELGAWLLLLDAWLWVGGIYQSSSDSIFFSLAELTENREEFPLRFAHFVRSLAYGDKSRSTEFALMINSSDREIRAFFARLLWSSKSGEEVHRERTEPRRSRKAKSSKAKNTTRDSSEKDASS